MLPVRSFSPYLTEALDTVLAERPGAVVVVDDGSPVPVALHPSQAAQVTLLRLPRQAGAAGARAAGVDALPADCDAVAFCDADDAWLPGSLALRVAALEAGVDWCFGAPLVVGPDGRPTGESWPQPESGPLRPEGLVRALYAENPVCTSSVVVRREALRRAGGVASALPVAHDWELWLRLAASGATAAAVGETVVRYRRHPGSLTADVAAVARDRRALHERFAEHVDAATVRTALAGDDAALAGGLARDRELRGALTAYGRAVRGRRPSPRPVLAGLRRRDPYRR